MNEDDIFAITDSTSAQEVAIFVEVDEGKLFDDGPLYDESMEFSNAVLIDDDSIDADKYVETGLDIASRFNQQLNLRIHVFDGVLTKYAIQLGSVLLALKQLVKGRLKKKWEVWAATNIRFLKESRRQIYMRIAACQSANKYAFLGLVRLNRLVQVVKENEGNDPIGDFLSSNAIEIRYDEDDQWSALSHDLFFVNMNCQIDTAIAIERIKKVEIEDVDKGKIKELIGLGTKVDASLIKSLKEEQKKGREPNEYLGILIANLGATPGNDNNQRHPASFNRQAATMSDTIDQYVEDDGLLDEVEETLVTALQSDLDSLVKRIAARKGVDQS